MEIVEERHAVGLRPHADFTRVREALIAGFDDLLAIEGGGELGGGQRAASRPYKRWPRKAPGP